jgi:hypothetical protein
MMQQVIRGLKLPPFIVRIPHLSAPSARIVITLLLVGSFSTAIVVVSALAQRYGEAYLADPFVAFADYFPGQLVDMRLFEAQGFSCSPVGVPVPVDIGERCVLDLQTGRFTQISVTIWDGIVKQLDFKVRDNSLTVGNLALLWGSPRFLMNGNRVNVNWPIRRITRGSGWSQNGRFTYFQALSQISFAR